MVPLTACLLMSVGPHSLTLAMQEPQPTLHNVRRIITMGDSITQGGEGPTGYVGLIRAVLKPTGVEVINAGISGHKATDMHARFQRDVIDKKPDLVTISVGVNDVWHAHRDFARGIDHPKGDTGNGVPLPLYREKVTAMVDATRAAGARPILLAPTLIYENLDSVENGALMKYIDALREIAKTRGCQFIDLNAPFRKIIGEYRKNGGAGHNLLTTDGVHLNDAGNRVVAYTILKGLGHANPKFP